LTTQPQRSLVLITVDCLRADHVGFLGYRGGTTPFLDSLAAQSWVFKNAVVAGTPTYYSFPAIMASRYPLAFGRDIVGLAPGESTLAATLRGAGYATAGFSAANPYLSRRFGYDQGFETFRDFLETEAAIPKKDSSAKNGTSLRSRVNIGLEKFCRSLGAGAIYDEAYFQYLQRAVAPPVSSLDTLRPFPSADLLVDQARSWLASSGQGPFFLWLHLMDPHSPYYPAQKSLALMGNARVTPSRARYLNAFWNRGNVGMKKLARHHEDILQLYDACIRWVDTQVERLAGVLRQFGRWENCVFALTADHGEEFLEHGGHYHAPTRLPEEITHVPVLLRAPGTRPRSAEAPFSLLHLAPTLLHALGAAAPESFQGKSYYSQMERGEDWEASAITECINGCTNPFQPANRIAPRLLAVRQRQYKLVVDFKEQRDRLFDLAVDAGECSPLPPDEARSIRRQLLQIARDHVESSHSHRDQRRRLSAWLQELKLGIVQSR
jgi:arylsulfatase A-like enzyme